MSGILVGVDGSDHSRRALRWAIHEAVQHHAPLTVMTVCQEPPRPATGIYWAIHDYAEESFDPEPTRKAIRQFVDEAVNEAGETPPEIHVDVARGDPAAELVNASHDADALVVGSRGSGGFARLLMGSVSSKVTHHAACPVVVVHPVQLDDPPATAGTGVPLS
jgi:nucleotide-binding universal stress UspA family protein